MKREIKPIKGDVVEIICADCGKRILLYKKENSNPLTYCDIHGILSPTKLAKIKNDPGIKSPDQIAYLGCDCSKCIGLPVISDSGKLSFRMVKGSFLERSVDHVIES